jgi:hypothetical protein
LGRQTTIHWRITNRSSRPLGLWPRGGSTPSLDDTTAKLMKWEIQLTGDSADLKMLSQSFNQLDLSVSEESGQFVLHST